MKNLLFLIVAVFTISCVHPPVNYEYGQRLHAKHLVSFYELLGNSEWYDGEPVSISGIAKFNFNFESVSELFASEGDYKNKTYGRVILEFESVNENIKRELVKLNGQYIHIQGIYYSYRKERIKPDEITICRGICGATGYIDVKAIF